MAWASGPRRVTEWAGIGKSTCSKKSTSRIRSGSSTAPSPTTWDSGSTAPSTKTSRRRTEEVMLKMASYLHSETGLDNLCLAGGVALNCVANGRILREGPFDALWAQPAAGDAGGALGAALAVWYQMLDNPRQASASDGMKGS